jgi:hypothetical protein
MGTRNVSCGQVWIFTVTYLTYKFEFYERINEAIIPGDQKVYVHLMITIQKITSNVHSVLRQSPDFC